MGSKYMILAANYGEKGWSYSKQNKIFMFFFPFFIYAMFKYDMVDVNVRKDK